MKRSRKPPPAVASASRRPFKVFVSSTFLDNQERRRLVQDAITMAGMVWHGMEIFTASTRPTVEECLFYAKEADLLVGIIAWRYGWEPDGKKSITEMEYAAAGARLMFFIDPKLPVNPDEDFDPGEERWKKQEKLEAFKARILSDQIPAFFTHTTLQAKVLAALNDWRSQREPKPPQKPPETGGVITYEVDEDLEEEIRQYRQKADALHATLPVAGFVTQLKVTIDIEDIYVPLHAVVDLRDVGGEYFLDAVQAENELRKAGSALEIALPEAFRQCTERKRRGVVILGDPGAGKTTHLKRLLLACLRKGAASVGLPEDMLPVFLPLRDLRDLEHGLDKFIQDQLSNPHLNTPARFGERLLKRGNLLILLDGLDEVADRSQRKQVAKWIDEGLRYHPTCWFVVTSRFAGYTPDVHLGAEFLEMHIRPLSEEQVAGFVHNWYRIVERGLAKDPEQAEGIAREKAEQLINRLREPDFRTRRVFELTRNPLLLTNICLVHRHRGALPKKRARLYEECIDVLLDHWRGAKGLSIGVTAQEARRVLQPAALWLHSKAGRTRATAAELAPHIEPVLKAVGWNRGSAEEFLRTIRDKSGLLTGWGLDEYGFMHRGFQEYLAAREIRSRAFTDEQVLNELALHFGESWWQEVTLLLLALEDPSLFVPFMREVVRQPAFFNSQAMVEMCLDDAAEISTQPFIELIKSDSGYNFKLFQNIFLAIRVLEKIDISSLLQFKQWGSQHPYSAIRDWFKQEEPDTRKETSFLDYIKAVMSTNSNINILRGHFSTIIPQQIKENTMFPIEKFYIPLTANTEKNYVKSDIPIQLTELWSSEKRLIICGEPGSGKTTFLRLIAYMLAKDVLDKSEKKQKFISNGYIIPNTLIPIFIDFSKLVKNVDCTDKKHIEGEVFNKIIEDVTKVYGIEKSDLLKHHLRKGSCVLLIDGFEKKAGVETVKDLINILKSILKAFKKHFIILSSRDLCDNTQSLMKGLCKANINKLTKKEISEFIQLFINNFDGDKDKINVLMSIIKAPSAVSQIAENPMMLTSICAIYLREKKIPQEKFALYDLVLNQMLNENEEKRKINNYDTGLINKFLKNLAFYINQNAKKNEFFMEIEVARNKLFNFFVESEIGTESDFQKIINDIIENECKFENYKMIEKFANNKLKFYCDIFQKHFMVKKLLDLENEDWWKIIEKFISDSDYNVLIEYFTEGLKLSNSDGLDIFSERIFEKIKNAAGKNKNFLSDQTNFYLSLITTYNPGWFAERVCKNAKIVDIRFENKIIVEIDTGTIAYDKIVNEKEYNSIGWDIRLFSVEKENVASDEMDIDFKVKQKDSKIIEFFADIKGIPFGIYQLDIRFLFENKEKWKSVQIVTNIEPINPYIAGPPIKDSSRFFGHYKTIEFINEKIKDYSLVILGPRRSGKTSILYRLKEHFSNNFNLVLIDLHSYSGSSTSELILFIQYEIYKMCRMYIDSSHKVKILDNIKSDLIENNVDNILLLIDEIAVLSANIDFAYQLRAMSKWDKPKVRIILAGTTRDYEQITGECLKIKGSWPLNEFEILEISRISKEDSIMLLEMPILGYYRYEKEAQEKLLKFADGRPFFLNTLANLSLKELENKGGRIILGEHVDIAIKKASEKLEMWYREFLNQLSSDTYEYLITHMTNPHVEIEYNYKKEIMSAGIAVEDGGKIYIDPLFNDFWNRGGRR